MKSRKLLTVILTASLIVIAAGGCTPLHEEYTVPGNSKSARKTVTETDLTDLVIRPVTGEDSQPSFSSAQYTGTIVWDPKHDTYQAETVYKAVITLDSGQYTLTDVSFTHGATDKIGWNEGALNLLWIEFPATGPARLIEGDLSAALPAPVKGMPAVTEISQKGYTATVAWKPADAIEDAIFKPETVYTAELTVASNPGYSAKGVAWSHGENAVSLLDTGVVQVVFPATESGPSIVWDLDLSYVTAPVMGAAPYTGPIDRTGYTGSVSWEPAHNSFQVLTDYTATVDLTAKPNFIFAEPEFVYHGGMLKQDQEVEVIEATESRAQVKLSFPAVTEGKKGVDDFDLTEVIPVPAGGGSPLSGPVYRAQYDISAITWLPGHTTFMGGTVYRADLTLTAKGNYSFAKVGVNSFRHSGIGVAVSNPAGTRDDTLEVHLSFPATETALITKDLDLSYIGIPVGGSAPPIHGAFNKDEYTGIVQWNPADNPFLGWKSYTATITLLAKSGYSFAGAAACTYGDGSKAALTQSDVGVNRVVTVTFPAGEKARITNIDLSGYINAPRVGVAPGTAAFTAPDQSFSGKALSWTESAGGGAAGSLFASETAYQAVVSLTAGTGHTFDTDSLALTHGQALSGGITKTPVSGLHDNITVTVKFPATGIAGILTLKGAEASKTYGVAVFRVTTNIADYSAFAALTGEGNRIAYREERPISAGDCPVPLRAISGGGAFAETGAFLVTVTVNDYFTGENEGIYYRELVPFEQGNAVFDLAGAKTRNGDLLDGALSFVEAMRLIQTRSAGDPPITINLTPEPETIDSNTVNSGLVSIVNRGSITIKGNGKKVSATGSFLLGIRENTDLTLENIIMEGGSHVLIIQGGNVVLAAGTGVTGAAYGGITIGGGSLTMEDGARIWNCTSNRGGGVFVSGGGVFTMKGGEITGNVVEFGGGDEFTDGGGGGVFVDYNGKFIMEGGKITNNRARGGGGVYVWSPSNAMYNPAFTMTGGEISGNSETNYGGGGVYMYSGTMTMSGSALIKGNTGSSFGTGGGVYVIHGGTLNMSAEGNPRIIDNTSSGGGGVAINAGSFNMAGGEISGNHAKIRTYNNSLGYGGGAALFSTATMTMSGAARITGNSAESYGGGVYIPSSVSASNLTITGTAARITGNSAGTATGGGVYAENAPVESPTFTNGASAAAAITGNNPDNYNW